VIVVKLRKPFQIPISFLPDQGFTWVGKVSFSAYTQPADYSSDFDFSEGLNVIPTEIGTVFIDNVEYYGEDSEANCRLTEKSWFFIPGTQELFIHIDHKKRMNTSLLSSLQIRGYSSDTVFYDDNNILYEPRLLTTPSLSDKVDRLRYEKLSLVSNTLSFDNSEGTFDYAFTDPVPGADVNILYISDEDIRAGKKSLTPIYTGYAESQKVSSDRYSVKMGDKRGQLNGKYPNDKFDAITYPNMESKIIGDIIPCGYGTLKGVPCFCTNGTVTTGDVLYKYGTDGTTLTTVYVEIDSVWTIKTPTVSDALNCTFTLSATDARESSGRYRKVKVDCVLRSMTNPADILVDMIYRYLGFQFNNDNYNIAEWGQERALLSDVGYYIDKRDEFFKLIEPLQNGSILKFIFRIDATGKFTIKVNDITRTVKNTYDYLDNLNDGRNVETDFIDYATSVNMSYSKDQESGRTNTTVVDTFKDETLETYRFPQELDFETLLLTEADAISSGAAILKDYKKARDIHTIVVRGIIPQTLLDVYRFNSSLYISGDKIREYAGNVKIKISDYKHDYETETTILTGYDISDIISKGTSVYSQGYMYDDAGYGEDFYYSPTTIYEPEAG
jgi:hypothetical protein